MIVSFAHNWIYIRAQKVASTSIEVALAPHCGPRDVITPIKSSNPRIDEDAYVHPQRNCSGYARHMSALEVRERVGEKVWASAFKFAAVRNPWDLVVSRYHWQLHRSPILSGDGKACLAALLRRPWDVRLAARFTRAFANRNLRQLAPLSFDEYVRTFDPARNNDCFYFDANGNSLLDDHIRYERLDEDFDRICDRCGLPRTRLPALKTRVRKTACPYASYYTDQTRQMVAGIFARQIDHFGYRFESAQ